MKKIIQPLILLCTMSIYCQIQLTEFTYENTNTFSPRWFLEYSGKVYFMGKTDDFGIELWNSDGTTIGTNILFDTNEGEADGPDFKELYSTLLNNELYFVTKNNNSSGEIWKTNEDNSQTNKIINYQGQIFGLTTVDSYIYFLIKTSNKLEVWKTNGTNNGTELIKGDIPIWNTPSFQKNINNSFVFTIQVSNTNNSRLWVSDGTTEGTQPVSEELDGNGSGGGSLGGGTSWFSQYIEFNNKLYFITRYALYETNIANNQTQKIADVWNAQQNLVSFSDVIEINNKMYFLFYSSDLLKLSIYESNGTENGTSEIYTITNSEYFYPSTMIKSGNNLIFTSINDTGGTSLFSLDTNNHTASEIIEIEENPTTSTISFYNKCEIREINDSKLFIATPTSNYNARNGWIYDNITESLSNVNELNDIYPHWTILNEDIYYSKNNQAWKFNTNSTLSTNEILDKTSIIIYPNPSLNFINFNSPQMITDIKIYDSSGRLVFNSYKLINNKIDITKLNSNIYFLTFEYAGKKITKKIIKN
jgi:ELWxxDGT repeat protein